MEISFQQLENSVFFVLVQLVLILAGAWLGGRCASWLKQPQVIGEICAGLLFGPSFFGRQLPELHDWVFHSASPDSLNVLSQVGLILLMFQIGLECDFSHLREFKNKRAVGLVALAGIALPFIFGEILGYLSLDHLAAGIFPVGYVLFLSTALSITAIPVLGRILMEFGLVRTRLGSLAISAAAINDVIGWILLAVVCALATSSFSFRGTVFQIAGLLVYFSACRLLIKPLLIKMLERFGVSAKAIPPGSMSILLMIIFLSALMTHKLGIFAIFGGFMIGVLLNEEAQLLAAWKEKISPFVNVFFLPIFFTYTGLRTDIHDLSSLSMWGWFAAVMAAATLGKFGGCYLAARMAGSSHHEAGCLGILMNTRGLMELVVVNVGYDLGLIPNSVFTILVLMAIASTILAAPVLRFWLPRLERGSFSALSPPSPSPDLKPEKEPIVGVKA